MVNFLIESLSDYFSMGVMAFMLIFVRLGTAMTMMPTTGDSFISTKVRLLLILAFCFILTPVMIQFMPPALPTGFALIPVILAEFLIGLLFGTIARIFITVLDTAGMIISMKTGISNAQLFNPSLATQGSLIGAFMSITGVTLLFATNLHHLLFMGLKELYYIFPVGEIPDTGSMANILAKAVSKSFLLGVQIGAPFIVISTIVYAGMGVLARVMPQIQVFILILPIQILLGLTMMSLMLTAIYFFWLKHFEQAIVYFLSLGG